MPILRGVRTGLHPVAHRNQLDGSTLAEQALAYAAELSVPTGATLLLVRAAYSHTLPGVDPRERQDGVIARPRSTWRRQPRR